MSRSKRFESARRLSIFPANTIKVKSLRHEHRGLRQQYVSTRVYPKASSMPSAACLFILLYGASRREGLRRCPDDPRCQVYGGHQPPTPFVRELAVGGLHILGIGDRPGNGEALRACWHHTAI